MHNNVPLAVLTIFAVAPLATFSIRMHTIRQKERESERAWKIVGKFIL